jgi:hypothetical protein
VIAQGPKKSNITSPALKGCTDRSVAAFDFNAIPNIFPWCDHQVINTENMILMGKVVRFRIT